MGPSTRHVWNALARCVVLAGVVACGQGPAEEKTGGPRSAVSSAVVSTGPVGSVPFGTTSSSTANGVPATSSDGSTVGPAQCPALVAPEVAVSLEDPGAAPLAERVFAGSGPQSFTVRSTLDGRSVQAGQESIIRVEDEFDLTAQRGADPAGVAPLWITLDELRLGDRTVGAEVQPAAQRAATAPQAGASVCLLHGRSGLTTLNSSTADWGNDREGVLQTLLAAQVIVFPEAAVGTGARWTRSATVENDYEELQEWSYQLTSVDEGGYEVHGTATHTEDLGEAQPGQSIPVTGGDMVAVARFEFTVVGRFDRPFPVSATITSHSTRRSESAQFEFTATHTLVVTSHEDPEGS
jgi:hypothetical protein